MPSACTTGNRPARCASTKSERRFGRRLSLTVSAARAVVFDDRALASRNFSSTSRIA